MKKTGLTIAMLLLTGCATQPGKKIDTTPKNPTAVLKASGVISGMILPDSTFEQLVYTRHDKRHISNKHKYDSWVARKLLGSGDDTVIFRMDKDLSWILSDKKYLECPLNGCSTNILALLSTKEGEVKHEDESEFQYNPADDAECALSISKNNFTVTETGETRIISGYETKEYQAIWQTEYKDEKGRKDKNTLKMVFWNTTPTTIMEEAWKIQDEATRAYRKAVKKDNNPLSLLLSDEIFDALSAFSGDTSKKNKKWNNAVSQKLATAKGYPISIKVDWYIDRKACPEAQIAKNPEKKGFDWSNPMGSLQDSVGEMASKKVKSMFAPDPNEPIFHYIYEVNNIAIEPVHDSVFEIPEGYTLTTRE
ncbi:MAG: hypothetical protein L3J84_06630 [Gammaproteobacteria bacterium]|nr:hypothetical protein [Gammaproteobacteria bacterium]